MFVDSLAIEGRLSFGKTRVHAYIDHTAILCTTSPTVSSPWGGADARMFLVCAEFQSGKPDSGPYLA